MKLESTRQLNNGVRMPWLGFGVWKIENDETERSVGWAIEAGYRHIDTAKIYGNEKGVGRAVRASGIPREQLFVTTKLWNDDMRAGRQMEAFEQSLADLDMEYVDLYLIHWPVSNLKNHGRCWKKFTPRAAPKPSGCPIFSPIILTNCWRMPRSSRRSTR